MVTRQAPPAPRDAVPDVPTVALPSAPPILQTTWSRSTQAALICLLVLAAVLLGIQAFRSSGWGSRPTDLERGPGLGYRIDLNRASLAELMQMPGVGEARAKKIIEYREQAGGFRKVSDLLQVHGIGPATFERLHPWICVGAEEADEEDEPPAQVIKRAPAVQKKAAVKKDKAKEAPGKKAAALKGKVNINQASMEELQKLPRIGAKTAQRIVEERAKGRFQSVDDLKRVRGIKEKTVEALRPYVTVEGGAVRVVKAE
jgi:competence protein ComEA